MSDADGGLLVSGFIFHWGEPDVNGIVITKDAVLGMVEHLSTNGKVEVDEENRRILWTVDLSVVHLRDMGDV